MDIEIRPVKAEAEAEMQSIYDIEDKCFPKAEQDSRETIYRRAKTCPDFFWVAVNREDGELVGFLNGMPVKQSRYTEEVFTEFSLYAPEGPWVMAISLNVDPAYRRQDTARKLLDFALDELRQRQKYSGMVFICKEHRVPYFSSFGAVDEGLSECRHGSALWRQMRLLF